MSAKHIHVGLLFGGIGIADWAVLQFAFFAWRDFYGIALVGLFLAIVGALGIADLDGAVWAEQEPIEPAAELNQFSLRSMLAAVSIVCILVAQAGSLRWDNGTEYVFEPGGGYSAVYRPATSMGISLAAVIEMDCVAWVGGVWLLWHRSRVKRRGPRQ